MSGWAEQVIIYAGRQIYLNVTYASKAPSSNYCVALDRPVINVRQWKRIDELGLHTCMARQIYALMIVNNCTLQTGFITVDILIVVKNN